MRDILVTAAASRRASRCLQRHAVTRLDEGTYIPELERNGATAPPSTGPHAWNGRAYGRFGTLAQQQEMDASAIYGSLRWRGYCESHGGNPAYVQARKSKAVTR